MIYPFFALAAQSPSRQYSLRVAIVGHLVVLLGGIGATWLTEGHGLTMRGSFPRKEPVLLGHLLLIAGIVEGSILIGWRLTQLPKSQALEFLLVSPLRPWRLLLAEALVGLGRLALVTLVGLPVLLYLYERGFLSWEHIPPLIFMPFTWGAVTGLGFTAWAYEPRTIRRAVESLLMVGIIFYLIVGVLLAEKLIVLLARLPYEYSSVLIRGFLSMHEYTPFAVLQLWLVDLDKSPFAATERMFNLEVAALTAVVLMLARAASRVKQHFHELHYRPAADESRGSRGEPGDRPLSWWAVRRVTEYSGRINLWLASGFGLAYAAYTVAGTNWPSWLGSGVFQIFEQQGGIPGLAAALVVLAAVPAAFQYGLWDSNAHERCRRLELLLLTELKAEDFWHAAVMAAWRRGRGYFAVAAALWAAAALAGKVGVMQALTAAAAGVILWGLYFTLGFRAFARGTQANGLGSLLTLGVPLLTYILFRIHHPALAALLPPGSVYAPAAGAAPLLWLGGPALGAVATVVLARLALAHCQEDLRRWYELHHGRKIMD